ncbi:MAG: hypothetical protein ACI8YI_001233 [Paracoccaceae bacterium]|jgi:uncharacterized protein YjiS (DUF1127 family)
MAYAAPSAHSNFSIVNFVREKMQILSEAAVRRRAFHQTRRELLSLSDAMLSDLGITRSEINRVALEASINATNN